MVTDNLKDTFKVKYRQYSNMLYKIAFLYLGKSYEAEDALQEVFTKYLYKSPKFKDDEHEKAWLIRVTTNTCKDMMKSFFRKKVVNIDEVQLQSSDKNNEILNEIIRLPTKYKTVIHLYYYEDYSVSKIAEILKISASAVKMRLHRGREILKLELEDDLYEKGIIQGSIQKY